MAQLLQRFEHALHNRRRERIVGICLCVGLLSIASVLAQSSPAATSADKSAADAAVSTPEYQKLYREAAAALQNKDYPAALGKLDALDRDYPNTYSSLNLRGAVYTKQKDYPKAAEAFAMAGELDKKAFAPRFNSGEVLFLQKKYPEARAKFEALLNEDGKSDLARYKVFLCYLANGEKREAEKVLNQFNFAGDMPAYYFAHAAWDFAQNNATEAQGWLQSASSIYSGQANMLFVDSLIELGYLQQKAPAKR